MALNSGSLFVGGEFFNYRGTSRPKLVKIDTTNGNLDTAFSTATGFDDHVNTVYSDGINIYVGGRFSRFNSEINVYFTRLNLVTGLPE